MSASASGTVTVWSLELDDPAAIRAPAGAPARALRVRRATEPGASERLYRTVGAGWEWTDRLHWGPERWARWEASVETHVAYADGEEAGYVELRPPTAEDASAQIAYFGLLPAFHGLRLGGHLLSFALRRALVIAPRVWVHTCSLDGPYALANYEARGLTLFRTETGLR